MKNDCIVMLVTCGSRREADAIVKSLVGRKIVACGTVAGPVASRFWWKGKTDSASEVLVMLKTVRANFRAAEREVRRLHSYEVPEIMALPVAAGSGAYLAWIRNSVKR